MKPATIETVDNFNLKIESEKSQIKSLHTFRIDKLIHYDKYIAASIYHEYPGNLNTKNIELFIHTLESEEFNYKKFLSIIAAYGLGFKDIKKYLRVIDFRLFKQKDKFDSPVRPFSDVHEIIINFRINENEIEDIDYLYLYTSNEKSESFSLIQITDLLTIYYGCYMGDMYKKLPYEIEVIQEILESIHTNIKDYGLMKYISEYPNFDKFKEDYKDYKLCLDFAEGFKKLKKI